MKRVKTLVAGDDVRVAIRIEISCKKKGYLMQWEANSAISSLTSAIMKEIPNARYLNISLCEIKVK